MRDVYILGIGQTEVGEHWETSLRHLALEAVEAALKDADIKYPDAMYVGNMLAPQLSNQSHLGALIADFCGLRGIEAVTVEAGNASGAATLRQAYIAVASGLIDSAMALGVEKITDTVGSGVNAALATMTDSDWEAAQGATPTTIAALIMRRYMHEYGVTLRDFAGFSVNAHANAKTNPKAMFRNVI
ncbi:MAG: beta-ketoacyl synthase N-terminal-like domain-containing protein, partial [Chloroflexota bacterium]